MEAIEKRFWKKVLRSLDPNKCWLWRAGKLGLYGGFRYGPRMHLAHRMSWMFAHGELPPPHVKVCHKCDNRLCCNPSHLFLGTQQQNIADMVSKGRQARGEALSKILVVTSAKGVDLPLHKLNDGQVIDIRERYAAGGIRQHQLATEYGVSYQVIGYVVRGQAWKHVGGPITNSGRGCRARPRVN